MRRFQIAWLLWGLCACSEAESKHDAPSPLDAAIAEDASSNQIDAAHFGNAPPPDAAAHTPMDATVPLDAPWRGEVPEVCDGSQRIRLWYHIDSPPARYGPGQFLPYQNGVSYWLVNGECDFYVQGTEYQHRPEVRSGHLDEEQAQEIGRRVHFGQSLVSDVYQPMGSLSDADVESLDLDDFRLGCYGRCDRTLAPPESQDAMANAYALVTELARQGEPWSGPMRITVVDRQTVPLPSAWDPYAIEWPLQSPIAEVSVNERDWNKSGYSGVVIHNPDDLQALRALPSQRDGRDHWPVRGAELDAGIRSYSELRIRDAIPLEDNDGYIRREWGLERDD